MFFPGKRRAACALLSTYIDFEQYCVKSEQSFISPVLLALPDLLFIRIIYRFIGCLLQFVIVYSFHGTMVHEF